MATVNRTQESKGQNFKQIEGDSWLSTYLPGICAGTVMAVVLLLAISCSKKNDKPLAKMDSPSAPAPANPAASAPAATAPQAPKKVKKHRPTTATYINSLYGVSFSYPRKYALKPSEELSLTGEASFLKPGSVDIVLLEMPNDSYPDTDFSSGVVAVRVNPTLTADECQQFGAKSTEPTKASAVKLGNNEFTELEQINGKDQGESDLKYFHTFKNQACYEFALAVETSRTADEDLAQVDRGKVFQQLEKIVTTARIKSTELPAADNAQVSATPEMKEAQPGTEKAQVMGSEQK